MHATIEPRGQGWIMAALGVVPKRGKEGGGWVNGRTCETIGFESTKKVPQDVFFFLSKSFFKAIFLENFFGFCSIDICYTPFFGQTSTGVSRKMVKHFILSMQ